MVGDQTQPKTKIKSLCAMLSSKGHQIYSWKQEQHAVMGVDRYGQKPFNFIQEPKVQTCQSLLQTS